MLRHSVAPPRDGEAKRGQGPAEAALRKWAARLNDPSDAVAGAAVALVLLLAEALLCSLIILKVPYTKIDWDAYMSQVTGFLAGERDYSKLEGDTGPLVYPAGFLYAYSALQRVTGGAVRPAQVLFAALYVANQAVVFFVYIQTKSVPPWALVLLCLSKRVHSIFVLRLFNDGVAMALLYNALALLQRRLWNTGLLVFSAAVSVKMNVLLFAPPLQLLLLKGTSLGGVVAALGCAAALQLVVGAPFLLSYPVEYLTRAFNLGRVFVHFWSVNFKFVPEPVFLSKGFSVVLLALHLGLLLLFAHFRWCRHEGGVVAVLRRALGLSQQAAEAAASSGGADGAGSGGAGAGGGRRRRTLSAQHITSVLLEGNFIGIVCARTLHYQFYSWYFHSIPFLLWQTKLPVVLRLLLCGLIEACWNVYPSSAPSSLLLLGCHLVILGSLWCAPVPEPHDDDTRSKSD